MSHFLLLPQKILEKREIEMEEREREKEMSGDDRLEEMSRKMTLLETYRQQR